VYACAHVCIFKYAKRTSFCEWQKTLNDVLLLLLGGNTMEHFWSQISMQRDLEKTINAWRWNCEHLQRQTDVNDAVRYTAVAHRHPCIVLEYTCGFIFSEKFQDPILCFTQLFLGHFFGIHTSVKAVLNHTAYILIWCLCVKLYGPTFEDGYW